MRICRVVYFIHQIVYWNVYACRVLLGSHDFEQRFFYTATGMADVRFYTENVWGGVNRVKHCAATKPGVIGISKLDAWRSYFQLRCLMIVVHRGPG